MTLLLMSFPSKTDHLRAHSKKVRKQKLNHLRLEIRFSHRVVNHWNNQPEHVHSKQGNIFTVLQIAKIINDRLTFYPYY